MEEAQTDIVTAISGLKDCNIQLTMNWNGLESPSIESERLVQVSLLCESSILSMAGHEESCQNQPGPPGKAKYSQETDSEPVP